MTNSSNPKIDAALASFISDHPDIHTREAAIDAILENWFTSHGYLPHAQEGTRPEDLDSTNDD